MTTGIIVIGAQKSATATLHHDLHACHGFLTELDLKESSPLLDLSDRNISKLERKIEEAGASKVYADVSTEYTMLPTKPIDHKKVNELIPGLKIVYIVRDPIERTLSHYQHDQLLGLAAQSFDESIHKNSTYVLNSLYGYQLEPWVEAFGSSNVLVIDFQEYIGNREGTIKRICAFAEVNDEIDKAIFSGEAKNVTDERKSFSKHMGKMVRSKFYSQTLKRLVSNDVRQKIKRIVQKPNSTVKPVLTQEQRIELEALYQTDYKLLSTLYPNLPRWNWL